MSNQTEDQANDLMREQETDSEDMAVATIEEPFLDEPDELDVGQNFEDGGDSEGFQESLRNGDDDSTIDEVQDEIQEPKVKPGPLVLGDIDGINEYMVVEKDQDIFRRELLGLVLPHFKKETSKIYRALQRRVSTGLESAKITLNIMLKIDEMSSAKLEIAVSSTTALKTRPDTTTAYLENGRLVFQLELPENEPENQDD